MPALNLRLPQVSTREEFMDFLQEAIYPARYDDGRTGGRLRELKTYILESGRGFASLETEEMSCELIDTGLAGLRILRAAQKGPDPETVEFYVDTDDDRFFALYTNDRSEAAGRVVESLTRDRHHAFDHVWFYSDMLKRLASSDGNRFEGFGVSYSDRYLRTDHDSDAGDLALSINGSLAEQMRRTVRGDPDIEKRMAYNRIRVARGGESTGDSIHVDIHNTGYLAVKKGRSAHQYVRLVCMARDRYRKTISDIEAQRIGPAESEGRIVAAGRPFEFELPSTIEDLDSFLERLFGSAQPFKLWGIKSRISDGYLKVMAVDLHTGSPMDFEISPEMIRVYLFAGGSGGAITRLFTNLQMYYDSGTRCAQLS